MILYIIKFDTIPVDVYLHNLVVFSKYIYLKKTERLLSFAKLEYFYIAHVNFDVIVSFMVIQLNICLKIVNENMIELRESDFIHIYVQ